VQVWLTTIINNTDLSGIVFHCGYYIGKKQYSIIINIYKLVIYLSSESYNDNATINTFHLFILLLRSLTMAFNCINILLISISVVLCFNRLSTRLRSSSKNN